MAFEQKDMTGALFTNDQKGNDAAPRYKGPCLVNGQKLFMSAWIKKDRNDKTYMSLAFELPREDTGQAYLDASKGGEADDLDSEIPF